MPDQVHEPERKMLPRLDIKTGINHSPHVVILGAGASRACCVNGDRNGRQLPVMADFAEKVGVTEIIKQAGLDPKDNFEKLYSDIFASKNTAVLDALDKATRGYFSALVLPNEPTFYDYLVLALRPKDTIVTFNWDPLLIQAYKRWRHLGLGLPELVSCTAISISDLIQYRKRSHFFPIDPN